MMLGYIAKIEIIGSWNHSPLSTDLGAYLNL